MSESVSEPGKVNILEWDHLKEQSTRSRLSYFRSLLSIANADRKITKDENRFLEHMAARLGITPEERQYIIDNPEAVTFEEDASLDQKMQHLTDLIIMMLADGKISDEEYSLVINFAEKLGFSQTDVEMLLKTL
jgi:uncharacterized tellurite resistance protein B-like protein